MQLLAFPDYAAQARRVAEALRIPWALVEVHRFPDGESKVRLPFELPAELIFCRGLDHPNDKLVELLLASATAREQGATHITLLAPYLCYMRQDRAFQPGEAVSQRIIGRWLAQVCDVLITVDPHLHRTRSLAEAVPVVQALALSAAPLMADFLRTQTLTDPLLLALDREAEEWVTAVARSAGLEHAVAAKHRLGDREVAVTLPPCNFRGREVVLVDDVASSGATLATGARALRGAGARSVHCLVTHALFVDDALAQLYEAGVDNVWTTDSISHPSNAIPLAELLAGAILALG
jgi:ribose-phosphate pyrophosphokinase